MLHQLCCTNLRSASGAWSTGMPRRKAPAAAAAAKPPQPAAKRAKASAAAVADGDVLALPNNIQMPAVAFGTYKFKEAADVQRAARAALKAGYRHIETAFIYAGEKTERALGAMLAKQFAGGELSRGEVFITSKHWRKYHGYEPTMQCLGLSLKRLQLDYIDLWRV